MSLLTLFDWYNLPILTKQKERKSFVWNCNSPKWAERHQKCFKVSQPVRGSSMDNCKTSQLALRYGRWSASHKHWKERHNKRAECPFQYPFLEWRCLSRKSTVTIYIKVRGRLEDKSADKAKTGDKNRSAMINESADRMDPCFMC
jgi:hypothetical protein